MGRSIKAEAKFIVRTGATVRRTAQIFGISKTTVHKDMTDTLKKENPKLYEQVREVLDKNKAERHIRGGIATREKYRKRRKKED